MTTPPDFSVGQVLTAAQMNAVGLWLIKTDTITSGSSKEITGVFSADFKNYKIIISNFASSVDFGLKMRMGTTATGVYYFASNTVSYAGVAATDSVAAGTEWNIRAVASSLKAGATIDLFSPYEAIQTSFASQATDVRTIGIGTSATTGFINNTTSYTSFTLSVGANTFTSCDVAVYGYRN